MVALIDAAPEMLGSPARHDVYLTDGVFLYRVVGSVVDSDVDMIELEDCYLLDIVRVPVYDLSRCRLRVVTPAAQDRSALCG